MRKWKVYSFDFFDFFSFFCLLGQVIDKYIYIISYKLGIQKSAFEFPLLFLEDIFLVFSPRPKTLPLSCAHSYVSWRYAAA